MIVAKVVIVIALLPDCDRLAVDAVSGYTQVKLEDAPRSLNILKPECSDVLRRLPRHKWPKSGANIEDFVVLDYVITMANSSQGEAQLYMFVDNEAVVKMIIEDRSPTMRHVSRTHRVALDMWFDRINLETKIQVKYSDTKNQFADTPTKGSCTQEWADHLLPFVEYHEYPDVFLQPFSFKQKAERHVQESSGKHGSRGFGGGETETDEFGVKEQLWRKENLPKDSSVSNSTVNQELDQSYVSLGVWKLMRNSDENPTAYSQERRQDDNLFSSTRALVQLSKQKEFGARWWQSNRKEKVGIPQYASLRLSIFWEGLQESAAKVESRRRGTSTQLENQRIDLVIIHVDSDDSRCSSWTKLQWTFGSIQEHQFRRAQDVVRHLAEIGSGPSSCNSECDTDWLDSSFMEEIYIYARPNDYVDESKSTRLLRFTFVENVRAFRSEPQMEKPTRWISTAQFFKRIIWNWWRTDWVRVKKVLRTYFIEDLPEDPKRLERSKRWLSLRFLKIEPSSCQCSMTSVGRREEILKDVFQIPNKSRITRRVSREDIGQI